jgi:hypothetical protein
MSARERAWVIILASSVVGCRLSQAEELLKMTLRCAGQSTCLAGRLEECLIGRDLAVERACGPRGHRRLRETRSGLPRPDVSTRGLSVLTGATPIAHIVRRDKNQSINTTYRK